mmetsp:Transcript_12564/g.21817  ORF Transcript_12564/g.21817 Transcript_12564/m.21817 type:complete len:373 (-) Transcript_12564:67-1185(-)
MGQVLSAPVTTKDSGNGLAPEKSLAWGFSSMQGWRISMEDAHLAVPQLEGEAWQGIALFSVMDGHGGEHVAHFCQKYLPEEIVKGSSQDVCGSLISAFHRMDEMLADPDRLEELRSLAHPSFLGNSKSWNAHPDWIGCTAVVCCVFPDKVVVANCGDSRAVLCRQGQAVPLSEDHKPNCPNEKKRINKAGGSIERQQFGSVVQFRVNGNLNLSRSIGDLEYKKNRNLPPNEQMICSTPDVQVFPRQANDEFFVIACDGIWDVMGSQDVIDFVRERLPQDPMARSHALQGIMEELLDNCVSPDLRKTGGLGGDNMTAMVVAFGEGPPNSGGISGGANNDAIARNLPAEHFATMEEDAIVPVGLCGCKPRDLKT